MAGTIDGGIEAAKTNKQKYGADFYAVIGAKGGRKGRTGGFASGPEGRERARKWGAVGGALSRRGVGPKSDPRSLSAAEKQLAEARKAYRLERQKKADEKKQARIERLEAERAELDFRLAALKERG